MKQIQVIGAGLIGRAITRRLVVLGFDVMVTDVLDVNHPKIMALPGPAHYRRTVEGLVRLVPGTEMLVNAGPHHINAMAISAASEAGIPYFDMSEDADSIDTCRECVEEYPKWLCVPACGLAPGFVSVVASHMAEDWTFVDSIQIRVGALPNSADNRLRHRPTWSIDGLVNEYLSPGEALWQGRIVKTESLRGREETIVCGQHLEAFDTAGGLGTLHHSMKDCARYVGYKTLRWRGHLSQVKMLVQELGLDRAALVKAFSTVRAPVSDVVYILIVVQPTSEDGMPLSGKFFEKEYRPVGKETAIERLTAAGLCAMVELYANGVLEQPEGLVTHESVLLSDYLATESGKEFGRLYL